MLQKIRPDLQKAKSLQRRALITLERLQHMPQEKYPSNTLLDYYDSIRQLLEALALVEGIKIKGEGAHREVIDFVCEKYSLEESTRLFLQEMRDYRNRISYEGFSINEHYITSHRTRIGKIIQKLVTLLKVKASTP